MKIKELIWVGSTKKDLKKLPEEVQKVFGYGLYLAQIGSIHSNAEILQGFKGAGVIEIKESDQAGTYRAVYTVKIEDIVFVLHVFQKKSKQGIKTPQPDINLINDRFQYAQEISKERSRKK
jgi:phage-related protein